MNTALWIVAGVVATIVVPPGAVALVVLMTLAAITHIRRGEPQYLVINSILGLLAAVVAWGRFGPEAV